MMASMKINDNDMKKLRVAFTRAERSPISSLDFHYKGELLVETCADALKVFKLGDKKVDEYTKPVHGAKMAKFYDSQHVIHSSIKDNQLRMLNLKSNDYIHRYKAHTDEVVSLAAASQYFFSSSKDKTVCMWHPNSPVVAGSIKFSDTPFVTNFTETLIAVAYNSSVIEIYDVGNLVDYVHRFQYEKRAHWTGIQFSPDGKMLMITTDSTYILIVSSSEKQEMHELSGKMRLVQWHQCILISPSSSGFQNSDGIHLDAAFSCDSKYVVGGSTDGRLHVWELEGSSPLCQIKSGYEGSCEKVAFNPAFVNVATTSTTSKSNVLHLWIEKCEAMS